MKKESLLMLEEDGEILFAKRNPDREELPGKWSFPAELVEENESPEEAAIRCGKEELGIDVHEVEQVLEHEFTDKNKILYYFKASSGEKPRIEEERELVELKYYTLDEFFEEYSDEEIGDGLQYLREKR